VILVSACLAGIRCRYDGSSFPDDEIIGMVLKGEAIPLCPEQLGGLPTPRSPCLLEGNPELVFTGKVRIYDRDGNDRTENFLRGADEVLRIVRIYKINRAILKDKSPSCGRNGVTAYLLMRSGIKPSWLQ